MGAKSSKLETCAEADAQKNSVQHAKLTDDQSKENTDNGGNIHRSPMHRFIEPTFKRQQTALNIVSSFADLAGHFVHVKIASRQEIEALQAGTNFDTTEIKKLHKIFMTLTNNEKKSFRLREFIKAMHELENIKMTSPNLIPYAERLFEIFDKDGMKALTLRQFVRGLAIACRGSVHDKQLLSFQVYDYNNDGSISKRNLITVLKLAWQNAYRQLEIAYIDDKSFYPLTDTEINHSSFHIASLMASNIFDAFNVEYIDFETFLRFAICEPKMTVHVNEFVVQIPVVII